MSHHNRDLVNIVLMLIILIISTKQLGQVLSHPQSNQFAIISFSTPLTFTQNISTTLPYPSQMLNQPSVLLTYRSLMIDHFGTSTPPVESWFYIKTAQITKTYTVVESNVYNQTVTMWYHKIALMVSCVDSKYFQIVNWEYNGNRLLYVNHFFNLVLTQTPTPFLYCYTDNTNKTKLPMNFMLNFNGFRASNWAFLSGSYAVYKDQSKMHIYTKSLPFTLNMYSDFGTWADSFYLGFLFFCPSSYMLNNKYIAQMKQFSVGNQLSCVESPTINLTTFTILNNYDYSYFIGMRFVYPNLDDLTRYAYQFQFDIAGTGTVRQYQVMKNCGMVEYNIFFIVQRTCLGNRYFNQTSATCLCDPNTYYFDVGLLNCLLVCPSATSNINNSCISCLVTFGGFCQACDSTKCLSCSNPSILNTNGVCTCISDRVIINSTCFLCSSLYGIQCMTCNSTQCLTCSIGLKLIVSNIPSCINCTSQYGSQCNECNLTSCVTCQNNFSVSLNGTCVCPSIGSIILSNGYCQSCPSAFGIHCLQCTISKCTSCQANTFLVISQAQSCMNCQELFGLLCLTCSSTECSTCSYNFTLNFTKTGCECTAPQKIILSNNTCVSCNLLYTFICLTCNSTSCTSCSNSYSIGANGNCSCPVGSIILQNSTCVICASLFGIRCFECDQNICTKCPTNTILVVGKSQSCMTCPQLYGSLCLSCNSTQCITCNNNFTLNSIKSGCQCTVDIKIILLNNSCVLCSYLFQSNCQTCNSLSCIYCSNSYSIGINGSCYCPAGSTVQLNGICTLCSSLFSARCLACNKDNCTQCQINTILVSGKSQSCMTCQQLYGSLCLTCSQTQCLTCNNNFTLNSLKSGCQCTVPVKIILSNNSCVLCNLVYELTCDLCNTTSCTSCSNSFSIGGDGKCFCPSSGSTLLQSGKCRLCSQLFGIRCLQCNSNQCTQCVSNTLLVAGKPQSCMTCQQLFGLLCLTCNPTECTTCGYNFTLNILKSGCQCSPLIKVILSNNTCVSCNFVYGSTCVSCNTTSCTSCSNSFSIGGDGICFCPSSGSTLLQNGQCAQCSALFGTRCLQCNSNQCTQCVSNTLLVTGKPLSCMTCQQIFGYACSSCTSTICLTCNQNFVLNSLKTLCQCTATGIVLLANNQCAICISLYGSTCVSCNPSSCAYCSNGYSISTNGICICPSAGSTLTLDGNCKLCSTTFDTRCLQCNSIQCTQCSINTFLVLGNSRYCMNCQELFGQMCSTCNQTQCFKCNSNFTLNSQNTECQCNSIGKTILASKACAQCKTLYGQYCFSCDPISCKSCPKNFAIINTSCICSIDRFIYASKCYLCGQVFGSGCIQCNQLECIKCKQNWQSLSDGSCECISPNQMRQNNQTNNNQCMSCLALYNQEDCQLLIYAEHLQIGGNIYISLSFNHPASQITQVTSITQNVRVMQGQTEVTPFWHKDLSFFSVSLLQNSTCETLSIQIINPKFLIWRSISLSNQIDNINVTVYDYDFSELKILEIVGTAVQYIYPIIILTSFGTFNAGFQMWSILGFYILIRNDLASGKTQQTLAYIMSSRFMYIFESDKLPLPTLQLKQVDFKEIIFSKNKGIIQLVTQIIVLYMLSVLISVYLKNYIKNKNNSQKYGIYVNYLKHYNEYSISNFYSLYPFLALCISIQIENMINTQWDFTNEITVLNAIVCAILMLIMVMMPIFTLNIFPFLKDSTKQTYSIIYNKVHPTGFFQFFDYLIRVFYGPIVVMIIFFLRGSYLNSYKIAQVSLIGLTLILIMLGFINYRNYVSKIFWFIKIIKHFIFLCFQVCFIFMDPQATKPSNNYSSSFISSYINADYTCMLLVVILVCSDFIELFIKLVRLIVINKCNYEEIYKNSNKIIPRINQTQQDISIDEYLAQS